MMQEKISTNSPINVVLTEDQELLREAIPALLSDVPEINMVATFYNGRELIEQINLLHVDVVVMDIRMPEMDGFQTTQFLQQYYPNIHILILTMLGDEKTCRKMLDAGAKGFLPKDVGKSDLIFAIKKVAMGETYVSPQLYSQMIDTARKKNGKNELGLSDFEMEVLQLIAQGYTNKEIAQKLFRSIRTIETHRKHLIDKTNCKNTAMLIKFAMEKGIILV